MYEKFYGLTGSPFELSPNPRFFVPTPSHNEALAILSYGVLRRKGFVVVTGEVGTGKTLLLRHLLEFIGRNNVASAFVYNPLLSVTEFLAYVLNDLRLSLAGRTKGEMLSYLNEYLLVRSRRGATTAIVVDEAHLLSTELLEEIRLLTNLETSQHKLVQLVLVGQPELDQKLDSPELRQLKQRVSLRCQLKPLTCEQSRRYIHRRLTLAGANSHATTIFPDETIAVISEFARGIPRIINNLCENALVSGYGKQTKEITADIIREVAAELRLKPSAVTSTEGQQRTDKELGIPLVSSGGAMAEPLARLEPGLERQ
jgi:type II secretory pathway predicted ATPase ExeA